MRRDEYTRLRPAGSGSRASASTQEERFMLRVKRITGAELIVLAVCLAGEAYVLLPDSDVSPAARLLVLFLAAWIGALVLASVALILLFVLARTYKDRHVAVRTRGASVQPTTKLSTARHEYPELTPSSSVAPW